MALTKLGFVLFLVCCVTLASSRKLRIKEEQWFSVQSVGQLYDIWYQNCYNEVAKKVKILWNSETMQRRWKPGYRIDVVGIFLWGFRLRLSTTKQYKPTNESVSMKFSYRAFFNSSKYLSNPCHNNGRCSNSREGHACGCPQEYWGILCQKRKVHCLPNPCEGGAYCTESDDDYTCECPHERTGRNCSHILLQQGYEIYNFQSLVGQVVNTSYRICFRNVAKNLTLHSSLPNFRAELIDHDLHGFSMRLLQNTSVQAAGKLYIYTWAFYDNVHEVNDGNPCLHGGSCYNTLEGHVCRCPSRFTGARCDIDLTECQHNPCINGGSCQLTNDGDHKCVCPDGFGGYNCNYYVASGTGRVSFPSKFLGKFNKPNRRRKRIVFDSCFRTNMLNMKVNVLGHNSDAVNATVINHNGLYFVVELAKARRSATRTIRVKWTATFGISNFIENPCLNGGTCINTGTRHLCTCADGFKGHFCKKAVVNCDSDPCENGGSCQQNGAEYLCVCTEGFRGNTCSELTIEALAARTGVELERGYYKFGPHPYICSDTKTVNVVYEKCYSGRPRNVSANASGNPHFPDIFQVTVHKFADWGFKANVQRTDKVSGWDQDNVDLHWKALFDPAFTQTSICLNGGFCHNSIKGHRCECMLGYTGKFCEARSLET